MIESLPSWIEWLFLATCASTIVLFHYTHGKPKWITTLIIVWSAIQGFVAYSGFYQITNTMPPRFALLLLPSTAAIILGLLPRARAWIRAHRRGYASTFLHIIRIPVEIVLLYLYYYGTIPELMTFEGRNFDILAGLTAPLVGWLYIRGKLTKSLLLGWNIVCLFLVCFILANGILSAELPFQQFAFDQPNRAVNYFPFVLLAGTIVPLVIYTHLNDILDLYRSMRTSNSN